MNSRSLLVYGIVLAAMADVSLAVAGSSWQKDDPSQWTSEDASQILSNSPWSKSVRVTVAGRSLYNDQGPGTGGNNGTWGSGGQMPGGGMGRGGIGGGGLGGGGMNGGGMGRGRNGGGYPPADEQTVTVLWQSALPVRLAEAKLGGNPVDPAAMKPLNEYVIAVIGLPKSGFRSQEAGGDTGGDSADAALAEHLKTITVLSFGQQRLNPTSVELNQGRDARTIFHFANSEPITAHDKNVEFRITSTRMSIEKKFALKDMQYQGKLEL